jgi:hypothetical protein
MEWAEGLEREADSIESDRDALRWALGSISVLFDRRATATVSDRNFSAKILRWSEWVWRIIVPMQIVMFLMDVFSSKYLSYRIGSGLLAFSWIYWAISQILDELRNRKEPPLADRNARLLFGIENNMRRLTRFRSIRRWFPEFVTVTICVGVILRFSGGILENSIWTGFVVIGGVIVIWIQCMDTPKKIQARIDRMNALITEGPPVNMKRPFKRLHSDHWGRPLTSKPESNL